MAILLTPGYVFADGEEVTRAKLALLAVPDLATTAFENGANIVNIVQGVIEIPVGDDLDFSAFEERLFTIAFPGASSSLVGGQVWFASPVDEVLDRFFNWRVYSATTANNVSVRLAAREPVLLLDPITLPLMMLRVEI